MSLKFKTRGNSNPQGKQKVYFCAHPEDFKLYFESIANEILAKQDCAVFYYEKDSKKDELELNEMNLFVMPVTTNLLTTENEALSFDFKFAKQHKIPVLPLMQESNLEELFNKKCGDLQFLDKNNHDTTAISYDEKLEKYLSSVLIGDEQAEKIRAAFDAYIFLSYRKKDRKHAQELMRLIHKNDFCRDIAIWYDEFLTPGEDFNESIKDAMEKSKLFAFAVTPNLVNEENYVQKIEYPAAKESGKPIIPAEMVETDKAELKRLYEDIPDCTNAHDDIELKSALMQAVENIAIRENDSDPEHNFFIGLAYLNGIDVEVDRERAFKLIDSAAESNLPEAIKYLAECYRLGNGTDIDYQKYYDYEEKLITLYQKKYDADPSEENGCRLVIEVIVLANWLTDNSYFDEGLAYAQRAFKICKTIKFKKNNVRMLYIVNCYDSIADAQCKKDYRLADDYYNLEHIVLKKMKEDDSNEGDIKDIISSRLFRCLQKRFDIWVNTDIEAASIFLEEADSIYKNNNNTEQSISLSRERSLLLERKGNMSVCEADYKEAKKLFSEKYTLDCNLYEETKNINDLRNASIALDGLASVEMAEKNLQEALSLYKQATELSLKILDFKYSEEAYRDLATCYDNVGNVYFELEMKEEAKDVYLKSFEIRIKLKEIYDNVQSLEDCGISCYKLGILLMNKQLLQSAYETFSLLSISTNRKALHFKIMESIQELLKII